MQEQHIGTTGETAGTRASGLLNRRSSRDRRTHCERVACRQPDVGPPPAALAQQREPRDRKRRRGAAVLHTSRTQTAAAGREQYSTASACPPGSCRASRRRRRRPPQQHLGPHVNLDQIRGRARAGGGGMRSLRPRSEGQSTRTLQSARRYRRDGTVSGRFRIEAASARARRR